MKKLLAILTVVVLTNTVSFAQNGQIGGKAGFNLANFITDNDDSERDMKIGIIIGGNYYLELLDEFSLDISLSFKQSGSQSSDDNYKISINYLDISPSISYNVFDEFALSVGPYLAFAISGEEEANGESYSIEFGERTYDDLMNNTAKRGVSAIDFGFNFGATISFDDVVTTNDKINLNAGFALGLNNLNSIDEDVKDLYRDAGIDIPLVINTGIFFTFGYLFEL